MPKPATPPRDWGEVDCDLSRARRDLWDSLCRNHGAEARRRALHVRDLAVELLASVEQSTQRTRAAGD